MLTVPGTAVGPESSAQAAVSTPDTGRTLAGPGRASGAGWSSQALPAAGDRYANCKILSVIHRGRDTVLYEVRSLAKARPATLAVFEGAAGVESATLEATFAERCRALREVRHPNFPELYEWGRDPRGRLYAVMQALDGKPLSAVLAPAGSAAGAQWGLPRAVWIGAQIASALQALHDKGIRASPLDPEKILVVNDAARADHVYLLSPMANVVPVPTGPGPTPGSAAYLAPEQVEQPQQNTIDHRADIFSLGVLLYRILTGRHPFQAATPFQMTSMILKRTPDPAPIPEALERVVFKCIEKRRERRFQSAREALDALLASVRARRPASVRRRLAAAAIVLLAWLAAAGVWLQPRVAARIVKPIEQRIAGARGREAALEQAATYPAWMRYACFSTGPPYALLRACDFYQESNALAQELVALAPQTARNPAVADLAQKGERLFNEGGWLLTSQEPEKAAARLAKAVDHLRRARDRVQHPPPATLVALRDLQITMRCARVAAREARRLEAGIRQAQATAQKYESALAELAASEKQAAQLNALDPDCTERCAALSGRFERIANALKHVAGTGFRAAHPDLSKRLEDESTFADAMLELFEAWAQYPNNRVVLELIQKHDGDKDRRFALTRLANLIDLALHAATGASAVDAATAEARLAEAAARCEEIGKQVPALAKKALLLRALALERRCAARLARKSWLPAALDANAAVNLGRHTPFLDSGWRQAAESYVDTLGAVFRNQGAQAAVSRLRRDQEAIAGPDLAATRARLSAALRASRHLLVMNADTTLREAWTDLLGKAPVPAEMVLIPAGSFIMGVEFRGAEIIAPNNSPAHTVELATHYMGLHEVTNAEFQPFVEAGGYQDPRYWTAAAADGVDVAQFKGAPLAWQNGRCRKGEERLPVTGVSWYEAMAYAAWAGLALPSEAQWERAASWTRDGRKRAYPWGETWRDGAAHIQGCGEKPKPVKSAPLDKSPAGCWDMAGNVREWTRDRYVAYPGTRNKDPKFGGSYVVVRGAGFRSSFVWARTTERKPLSPLARKEDIGFRCVWTVPSQR